MGHARAHQRQSECDVHGPMHAEQFDRDVALIVVQGHDPVEAAHARPQKKRVGGEWPRDIEAGAGELLHGRRDDPRFLVAKEAAFTTMRVEGGDDDPRPATENGRQQRVEPETGLDDAVGRQVRDRVGERFMERGMHDAQALPAGLRAGLFASVPGRHRRQPEHHRGGRVGQTAGAGEPFGVAGHVMAGRVQRLLVKRTGHDRLGQAGSRGQKGGFECRHGAAATGGADGAPGNAFHGGGGFDHQHAVRG